VQTFKGPRKLRKKGGEMAQQDLEQAKAALKRQDFQTAISHFEAHLDHHPRDLETLLELGIAYLLGGKEADFLKNHQAAAQHAQEIARSSRLTCLWAVHVRFAARFARAAAVLSMVSLPIVACQTQTPNESPTKTSASGAETPGTEKDVSQAPNTAAADVAENTLEAPLNAGAADVADPPQADVANTEANTDVADADAVDADAQAEVLPEPEPPRKKYGVMKPKYRVMPPDRPKMKYGVRQPDEF